MGVELNVLYEEKKMSEKSQAPIRGGLSYMYKKPTKYR